jgi:formylmethanofuran dehydrogenase subunit D
MPTEIIVAPVATLSEFSITFNNYAEIIVTAKDADGNDISRSGGITIPNGPFALLFNPATKDWITATISDFPIGYELVQCILGTK